MLKTKEILSKKQWEDFLRCVDFYPLFQSWNWGETQKLLGRKVLRWGIFDDSRLIGVCSIFKVRAKRGDYLHLRHGPVFLNFEERYLRFLIEKLKKLAKDENVSFIRLSPLVERNRVFDGLVFAPIHNMDAEICWLLDITKPEEQLLKDMRKTHRYLIKKAQGLGVRIIKSKKYSDIESFLKLYQGLSQRKHFVPHQGIQEEFKVFGKDDQTLLFLAEYQKKIIAGSIVLFVGGMAIYHHGASDFGFKDIPSSYLLQWEAILEAKRRGKKIYNFWGIAHLDSKNHPWRGLTLFKTGFGGEKREFLHARDLPLSPWYFRTYLVESATKLLKGY